MGGIWRTHCKKCNLEFSEETKHLFTSGKHKLKDGSFNTHYNKAVCKACLNKKENSNIKRNRAMSDFLKSQPCTDCGKSYPPYVMHFDHLKDKTFNISRRIGHKMSTLLEEIDKCEVVCANCHAIRTHNRRKAK